MENKEIIEHLQTILIEYKDILTSEQKDAINDACPIIKKANTREQLLKAAEMLGPLIIQLGSKFFGP